MGLFSREAPCDVCGATLAKKDLQHFDPTWRRERKTADRRRRLCAGCLSAVMGEYFQGFAHRALAIVPTPEGGAYSFAPLDHPSSFVWSDELKEQVRRLLPAPDAKCRRCGRPAPFTWCGLDAFADNNPFQLRVREPGQFAEEPLCGSCAAAEFDRIFRASSAVYQEVLPPADGDGLLTPAEC